MADCGALRYALLGSGQLEPRLSRALISTRSGARCPRRQVNGSSDEALEAGYRYMRIGWWHAGEGIDREVVPA